MFLCTFPVRPERDPGPAQHVRVGRRHQLPEDPHRGPLEPEPRRALPAGDPLHR